MITCPTVVTNEIAVFEEHIRVGLCVDQFEKQAAKLTSATRAITGMCSYSIGQCPLKTEGYESLCSPHRGASVGCVQQGNNKHSKANNRDIWALEFQLHVAFVDS